MFKQYFDEYSERLSTYNFFNWPYRDSKLKPSKMAQIGYFFHDDFLKCYCCQKKLIIDDIKMLGDNLLQNVTNLHETQCQAMSINFTITQEFLYSYGMAYYDECLASWEASIEIKKTYLDKVPNNFHFLIQNSKQVLAIFGWIKENQFLSCKFCGRKCQILDEEFDVFNEHRYFCKWANEGKNIQYGYLIVLKQLRDQNTQKKIDNNEKPNEDDQYIVKTLIQQSEEIVSLNLQNGAELQKVKVSMNEQQEQLAKRKRFDIQELERENEEFELEIQKKVKVQSEGIEKRIKEQSNIINQQFNQDESDIQQNQDNNSNINEEIDQFIIDQRQTIQQENKNPEIVNKNTDQILIQEKQLQQYEDQNQDMHMQTFVKEQLVHQKAKFNQEEKDKEDKQIIQEANIIEKYQPKQPKEIDEQEIKQKNNQQDNNLNTSINENFETEQNNKLINQNEDQHETDQKLQNLQENNSQNSNSQNRNLNKKDVIENQKEAQIQSQEIEIEKEINKPQEEEQEINKDTERPKLIEDQEIQEISIQNDNNENDKNQNRIASDQQQINEIDREEENNQQNQENFIQLEADGDQDKNEQSLKNIPLNQEQNEMQIFEQDNKIETIINLEDQIASSRQNNQEIEQELQIENLDEIEIQENDGQN